MKKYFKGGVKDPDPTKQIQINGLALFAASATVWLGASPLPKTGTNQKNRGNIIILNACKRVVFMA